MIAGFNEFGDIEKHNGDKIAAILDTATCSHNKLLIFSGPLKQTIAECRICLINKLLWK
jgi:hypothetical protein